MSCCILRSVIHNLGGTSLRPAKAKHHPRKKIEAGPWSLVHGLLAHGSVGSRAHGDIGPMPMDARAPGALVWPNDSRPGWSFRSLCAAPPSRTPCAQEWVHRPPAFSHWALHSPLRREQEVVNSFSTCSATLVHSFLGRQQGVSNASLGVNRG